VIVSAASAWEITTRRRLGKLPEPHRDPFDRMLIAHALARDIALVSNEAVFAAYGARRLW
jgi:PIN domain nuclease of toxin-antitoxin system